VTIGSSTVTAAANGQGSWTATMNAPALPKGTYPIRVNSSTPVDTTTFSITPTVSLAKRSGGTGATITVTGNGFAPNESGVSVLFGGQLVVAPSVAADLNGAWTASFAVPPLPLGSYKVTALSPTSQSGSVREDTFNILSGLTATPARG